MNIRSKYRKIKGVIRNLVLRNTLFKNYLVTLLERIKIMPNRKNIPKKDTGFSDEDNSMKVQFYQQLDGQKFVLGCMLMKIIQDDPSRIPQVIADIDKYVTRKADIKRLETFKNEISNKLY